MSREVMQQALEALRRCDGRNKSDEGDRHRAITALRQALEQQPADEPVAWMWYVNNGAGYVSRGIGFHQTNIPFAKHTPLYTRPSQPLGLG